MARIFLRLFTAATALVPLVAALTEYNMTVTDMSPTIKYTPEQPGIASEGWNATYNETPWTEYTNTTLGEGTTLHTTTLAGASAEVQFAGIGVAFYGSGSGNLVITLDGEETTHAFNAGEAGSPVQLLAQASAPLGHHTAAIRLTDGSLSLARVVMTTNVGAPDAKTEVYNVTALSYGYYGNVSVQYQPQEAWQENERFCGMNDTHVECVDYTSLGTSTPGAHFTLYPPRNSSIVYIIGNVGMEYTEYSVTLDPVPPFMDNGTVTLDASQSWRDYGVVLYTAMLDPLQQYFLTITHAGSRDEVFEFGRASFVRLDAKAEPWSPTNSTSGGVDHPGVLGPSDFGFPGHPEEKKKGTNVGAIVGGTIGGVAGVALFACLMIFCRRKPHRPADEKDSIEKGRSASSTFEIDPPEMTTTTSQLDYQAADADHHITPLPVPQPGETHQVPLSATAKATQVDNSSSHPLSLSQPDSATSPMGSAPSHAVSSPVSVAGKPTTPTSFGASTFGAGQSAPQSAASLTATGSPATAPGSSAAVAQAEDAGRVQEVVPPQYNPAWARE